MLELEERMGIPQQSFHFQKMKIVEIRERADVHSSNRKSAHELWVSKYALHAALHL